MEEKINTLAPFFEEPNRKYSIRELGRKLKVNHTTIRKYLIQLVKEGYLSEEDGGVYRFFTLNIHKKTLNLKLYYNLEKLQKSEIVEALEKYYDFPAIVLFGSFAQGMDDMKSDIDIYVLSNIAKEMCCDEFEKTLNRKVSLHLFSDSKWKKAKEKNTHLVNSISNGITLSGELEVL